MIRSFFRDSAIYTIPSILSYGISFFLIPLYTRVLSPSDYGALDMMTIFGSLITLTVALEVSQGVARFYQDEKTSSDKSILASTALWFTVFVFTLFCIVAMVFAPELSQVVLGVKDLDEFFRWGVIYIFVNGLFNLIKNQFRWEIRSGAYSIVNLVYSIVTAVMSILLSYVFQYGLYGLITGMIIGTVSGSILALWYLRTTFRFWFDLNKLKTMLNFSVPLVPSSISVFVSMYVDRLIINNFMSLSDVGIYGVGFRLANVSILGIIGFQGALTPLIYKHYKEPETPVQIATIFRIFIGLVLLIFLVLVLFSENILWLITTPAYYSASQVVVFLVPAILISQMYIFTPGIGIARKTKITMYINIMGACINAFLNWLLVPMIGIIGAGISTLTGSICLFGAYLFFSQKFYPIPFNWKIIIPAVLLAIILVILGVNLNFGTWVDFIIRGGLIIFMLFSYFLFGLLKKDEIIHAARLLHNGISLLKKK